MARCGCLLALSLGLCLTRGAEGRFEAGTARLATTTTASRSTNEDEARWRYLGKFGYAIGTGSYDVRVRLASPGAPRNLKVEVFLDEEWPQVSSQPACSPAVRELARTHTELMATQEWSLWSGGVLTQGVRPHIWYFALSSCERPGWLRASNASAVEDVVAVDFELSFKQADGSELSVELRFMPGATLAAVLILTGLLARFLVRCQAFRRRAGALHPVIRILAVAMVSQWMAEVLHLLHLHLHERHGSGDSALETSADVLFMLSQVVSSTLLVAIARGYTLLSSKERELSTLKPTGALIALIHVALVGHGKLQGDSASKHHENGGVAGWTLVAVRLFLCAWFLACAKELLRQQRSRCELRVFLQSFRALGCLYFLSYPAIYIVGKIFAEYLQHPVMHVGLVAMQTAAVFWLAELFLSKGSKYNQVSTLCNVMLPQPATSRSCSPAACSSSSIFCSPSWGSPVYRSPVGESPVSSSPMWGTSPHFKLFGGNEKLA